jgi:chemotaxis protein methyltransferase CheR/type IV pilus assembly protein PilK
VTDIAGQSHAYEIARRKGGRLPEIDEGEFADWQRLLEHRFGLFIAPERKSFLVSGLRTRMRETGCGSYRDYYRRLSRGASQAREWSMLVDCLTVHETCFFRHASSLKLVDEIVLPDTFGRGEKFNAWSIGCATGEEPYSLAMQIDAFCSARGKDCCYGVTGTDISLPAIRHARSGIYLNRRLANIGETFQAKYTRPVSHNRFEIASSLRKRVCFTQLNLRDIKRAPFADMDLIYCQNVLIYYDRERRIELVGNLVRFLRPGGVLVLGPGEVLHWQHPMMRKVRYADTLAYRRIQE